ncbi:hypothetical protein J6590_097039, partial [Homalodisca vitripennis]
YYKTTRSSPGPQESYSLSLKHETRLYIMTTAGRPAAVSLAPEKPKMIKMELEKISKQKSPDIR